MNGYGLFYKRASGHARTITLTKKGQRHLAIRRLKEHLALLGYRLLYTADADGIHKEA